MWSASLADRRYSDLRETKGERNAEASGEGGQRTLAQSAIAPADRRAKRHSTEANWPVLNNHHC